MRKYLFALVAATCGVCWMTSPAAGITYGEPDAGEHPYVGFLVMYLADEEALPSAPGWISCSGTMLDARTMLTAGHCTYGIGTDGAQVVDADGDAVTSGGTDVWVTLEETNVLAGWPLAADFPDAAALYTARRAWLEANPDFTNGTAIPDPRYSIFAEYPFTYDVGVVELDADAPVSSYGELAPLGAVEALVDAADGPNDALVETVGYGRLEVHPVPVNERSRYKSTSRIVELNATASEAGNLHTSNNPSAVGGRGGSCSGDSGGPVLVNNTNVVLAVVSFGNSNACHGADYGWRVDTESSREFLSAYVD